MKQVILFCCLFSVFNAFGKDSTGLDNHRNKVLKVFNKAVLLDENVKAAIKAKNTEYIENARKQLLQYSVEGMKEIDAIENFEDDASLKFSCKDVLKFYKQLAEIDLPQVRDFFIQEENFLKIKKDFSKKPVKKHWPEEIIAYNSEADKYNKALTHYTQLTSFMDNARKLTFYNWNASEKIFTNAHKQIK